MEGKIGRRRLAGVLLLLPAGGAKVGRFQRSHRSVADFRVVVDVAGGAAVVGAVVVVVVLGDLLVVLEAPEATAGLSLLFSMGCTAEPRAVPKATARMEGTSLKGGLSLDTLLVGATVLVVLLLSLPAFGSKSAFGSSGLLAC